MTHISPKFEELAATDPVVRYFYRKIKETYKVDEVLNLLVDLVAEICREKDTYKKELVDIINRTTSAKYILVTENQMNELQSKLE